MIKSLRRRVLNAGLLAAVAALSACAVATSSAPPSQPPLPAAPSVRTVATSVFTESGQPVAGAVCSIDQAPAPRGPANAGGYVAWDGVATSRTDLQLTCSAPDFNPFSEHRRLATAGNEELASVVLTASHVDPSLWPLEQLAAIRGAMWPSGPASTCGALPFGPRPGQADNIIATDFFANYSSAQQQCIVDELRARGYTDVVMGPIVDSDGYHGQYAPHDWRYEDVAHVNGDNFEKFLDVAQYFYDHGLTPVVFGHPDGWTFEETRDALTPLLSTQRAQRLIRIFVPAGWEPTRYDWSSCTWRNFAQWARLTLPNALILLHTVADVDAPVGTDAACDDNGHPNAEGWARIAPFVHGWLIQNGAYTTAPSENPSLATNFCAQFQADGVGADQHSVAWHFAGNAGWPTFSAWGQNQPLLLYAGEDTAFSGYWQDMKEPARVAWGDLAMRCHAAGYLDGGTVAVPPPTIHR